jgi:hypothetical protein
VSFRSVVNVTVEHAGAGGVGHRKVSLVIDERLLERLSCYADHGDQTRFPEKAVPSQLVATCDGPRSNRA